MKPNYLISTMCAITLLSGCTDGMEDVAPSLEMPEMQTSHTRAITEDSVSTGSIEELIITDDMKRMAELYAQQHSQRRNAPAANQNSYDDTFGSNIYAIRDLPATIRVRNTATSGATNGYANLYCDGKGKEVTLNNSNDAIRNRFYIKTQPNAMPGFYLIYSEASGTPLTVGYYTNKPNENILMAAKENNIGFSWSLLCSDLYKNYYSIQSMSFVGKTDPNNPMSPSFYYVLEAVSGNKIRYAQRVSNKAQQEFIITPDKNFELYSLEYDVNPVTISKSTFTKTVTVKNTSSQQKDINVPFNFYETESSCYDRSAWNVSLNFSNPSVKFQRPTVTAGNIISPEDNSPADANFINSNTQYINRHIQYQHPIRCNPSSIAKVTLKFVKYQVTIRYTAKAQCEVNGDRRECILKGTWSGDIIENPEEISPEETITYTPIGSGGDIILKEPTFVLKKDSLILIKP